MWLEFETPHLVLYCKSKINISQLENLKKKHTKDWLNKKHNGKQTLWRMKTKVFFDD